MDKVFPPEIDILIKRIKPKAAFISENKPIGVNDCKNCGGMDMFYVFIATKGPFATPSSSFGGDVSTFDPTIGKNGGWWVGKSFTYPCPVCKGKTILTDSNVSQYPTKKAIKKVFA